MGQRIDLQEDKKINLWISPVLMFRIFHDCVRFYCLRSKKKKKNIRTQKPMLTIFRTMLNFLDYVVYPFKNNVFRRPLNEALN